MFTTGRTAAVGMFIATLGTAELMTSIIANSTAKQNVINLDNEFQNAQVGHLLFCGAE